MSAMLAVLAGLASCAAHRVVAPADPTFAQDIGRADPVIVAGYTTTDGRFHEFNGILTLKGDSLVLAPRGPTMRGVEESPQRAIVLAKDEVVSLKLYEGYPTPWRVLIAISLLVALVAWMRTWDFAQF